jgi:hypothetical protein
MTDPELLKELIDEAEVRARAWIGSPAGAAAKQELARLTVSFLYADFDVPMLEDILAAGRKYETEEDLTPMRMEVRYMNEALAAEIERRKEGS